MLDFSMRMRERARVPKRGTSGSVQRGPANPARPGREQRYRERLGCRSSPEVPRILELYVFSFKLFVRRGKRAPRQTSSFSLVRQAGLMIYLASQREWVS